MRNTTNKLKKLCILSSRMGHQYCAEALYFKASISYSITKTSNVAISLR
jgi:hypothetical protein